MDGSFDNNVPNCEPCHYKCNTCIISDTNCVVCANLRNSDAPTCSCIIGTYDDSGL